MAGSVTLNRASFCIVAVGLFLHCPCLQPPQFLSAPPGDGGGGGPELMQNSRARVRDANLHITGDG